MSEDLQQLSDDELTRVIGELQEASHRYNAAFAERTKRALKRDQKQEEEERRAFLASDKFKKIAAKYRELMQRIQALPEGKQTLTLDIPVTLTFSTETDADFSGNIDYWLFDNVFEKTNVVGKVGKTPSLTRRQRALLQTGLNSVVADACDEIYDFFPLVAEQEKTLAELIKVVRGLESFKVTFEDLEVSA